MCKKARFQFRRADFLANERGNTIMIFGLSLMPVMLMLGATVDFTRYAIARAALQQATDSSMLMVASKMTKATTVAGAQAQAQVMLNAQPRMSTATVTTVTITQDWQTVCADSQITVKNTFMQLANIGKLTPTAKSCANLAGSMDGGSYEIALVLDNSGSMSNPSTSGTKMDELEAAAKSFVDTMYGKSDKVKMSITPFNAAVKAVDPSVAANRTLSWIDTKGDNSQHWIVFGGKAAATAAGFTSRFDIFTKLKARNASWDWYGCFEPQTYPMNVNDTPPDPSNAETLFVPFLAPDEPEGYNNNYLKDLKKKSTVIVAGDNPSDSCSDTASNNWDKLRHVCKYKSTTSSLNTSDTPNGPSVCSSQTSQTIMQLTSNKTDVTNKITALQAGGYTNLHEGFMWGWRTISPNAPFAAGSAYKTKTTRKVMVFMTDGFNNWSSQTNTVTGSTYQAAGYYSYNGTANVRFPDGTQGNGVNYQNLLKPAANTSTDYHDKSRDMQDELTLEACTNAKAQEIEIFTIGFSGVDDPIDQQGLDLMKACATNEDHYFAATNAAELNAAFAAIGIGLGKLRLSL